MREIGLPRWAVALAVGVGVGMLIGRALLTPEREVEVVVQVATPTPAPALTPTPASRSGRCVGGRWALPVRRRDDRITATFGVKGSNSPYFRAMQDVGAVREGAQAIFHTGVDFGLRMYSPVYAVADARVISYTYSPRFGNHLVLRLEQEPWIEVMYGHLHSAFFEPGDRVRCGEVVAISGASGRAVKGAHLHFEVRVRGRPVDPTPWIEAAREGLR